MKGTYRAITGLLSFLLLFGTYGCRDKKQGAPERVHPDYQAVSVGKNEYRVRTFKDLPPSVSIESSPEAPVGVGADIYVRARDRGNNAGINEVVVYEDGNEIGIYKPDPRCGGDWVDERIPICHWVGGERSYHAEATDRGGQKTQSRTIKLNFSGKIIDPPPTVRFQLTGNGFFKISPHDYGDRCGIKRVTLFEDNETTIYSRGDVQYSTASFPLPAGRTGKHNYVVEVEDNGGQVTRSQEISVDFIE